MAKTQSSERPPSAFAKALKDVERFTRRSGFRGAVIGGIAIIARGVARFTADIDLAVVLPPNKSMASMLDALKRFGFELRIADGEAFAEENRVILARHRASGVAVDVSLAQLDFELRAIDAAESIEFGGARLPVPRATDLVIYKLVAARPKDVDDVRALLDGGAEIDAEEVMQVLSSFDALLDTDRASLWRRLTTRE